MDRTSSLLPLELLLSGTVTLGDVLRGDVICRSSFFPGIMAFKSYPHGIGWTS
jgi:hypothetical protein